MRLTSATALAILAAFVPMAAPAQTAGADAAVAEAGKAAGENRHADAIDAYRRAISAAPERRGEWLLDLADQLTWAKRYEEAVALYREAVDDADATRARRARMGLARALSWDDRHGQAIAEYDRVLARDPKDRDARLARAQVLSWAGRHDEALAAYEALSRDDPEDVEAKRGAARVLSWRGRYRAAIEGAQGLLEEAPRDRETVTILAEALDWMGRPDRAERVLREQLERDAGDARAASLLDDLARRRQPSVRVDFREFDQSDDLEISELALAARFPLAQGRGFIGPRYTQAVFRPNRGDVERILVRRPGLYGGFRISDAVDLNAGLSLDVINTRGAEGDHTLPTFDGYLTYRPNDLLRFDLGASRYTFDSEETLREGLVATQIGGSVDFYPNEAAQLSARFNRAYHSDGNVRLWWQAQVTRRLMDRPRLVVGYRYTGFRFSDPGQGGYYNPDRYRTHELLFSGSGQLARRLRWDLRLVGGYETETPGGSRFTINAGASAARPLGRSTELELAYDYSTSRTRSVGGFERGIARVTLFRRFGSRH
jgi:tetratricopeptide (TPR) repeat protein